MDFTACWMVRVMSLALILVISLGACVNRRAKGVPGGALLRRRYTTRLAAAFTGHTRWSPLHPRPITSPRTPFFCVVNVRVILVADRSCWSVAVAGFK